MFNVALRHVIAGGERSDHVCVKVVLICSLIVSLVVCGTNFVYLLLFIHNCRFHCANLCGNNWVVHYSRLIILYLFKSKKSSISIFENRRRGISRRGQTTKLDRKVSTHVVCSIYFEGEKKSSRSTYKCIDLENSSKQRSTRS